MIRLIALIVLAACSLLAQVPNGPTLAVFTASKETTGTSEKITIQQPDSGSRKVRFVAAYIYCSAGCDVVQSRNGTAATGTALTPAANNGSSSPTAKANAFHTSNVGSGTAVGATLTLGSATGYEKALDLSGIYMMDDGTSINYTIAATAPSSGTIRVSVKWEEF